MHRTARDTCWRIMSAMLGVIRPSLAGRSMMVLLAGHTGVRTGPNIIRNAPCITSEASPQTDRPERLTVTRRFEAKLHWQPVVKRCQTLAGTRADFKRPMVPPTSPITAPMTDATPILKGAPLR